MRTAIVQRDGQWFACAGPNLDQIGGPFATEESAQKCCDDHAGIIAIAAQSREDTKRELGYYYDPTD